MAEAGLQKSLFGVDQEPLPGLAYLQTPLMAAVHDLQEWPVRPLPLPAHPGTGQLSFGPNQLELSDVEPEPIQMSLIGDAQPWEQSSVPSKKKRRRPRRVRQASPHDQMPLFPQR